MRNSEFGIGINAHSCANPAFSPSYKFILLETMSQ